MLSHRCSRHQVTSAHLHPNFLLEKLASVGGFLLQCTLVFNRCPHFFSTEESKISYMIGLFCERALKWDEAQFKNYSRFKCSFKEFIQEFKEAFLLHRYEII
ncbi:hypothetical protein CRENBAI_019823 [Crenichthys baileyi]|uniref:DUF4939 domain-containing protein n=1 Tax=Crenichthys baileyi TaxID=28760 RepID=A0AAV9RQL7_9TELE